MEEEKERTVVEKLEVFKSILKSIEELPDVLYWVNNIGSASSTMELTIAFEEHGK